MLERAFEILVRRCAADIFPKDWKLKAQQLNVASRRLDMLYADSKDILHIVELKKGKAKIDSVDQAIRYAKNLKILLDGAVVKPWVVAHKIPPEVEEYAIKSGTRTLEISISKCEELIIKYKLSPADLIGERREKGVLHGGSGGVRKIKIRPNREVYKILPQEVARVLKSIEKHPHCNVLSGAMQTVIHYRGVKLGGYNRTDRGGHGYITEGVVLNRKSRTQLENLGFRKRTKTQKSSNHEHIWWEISSKYIEQFAKAIQAAKKVVDRSLNINEHSN